LTVAKHSDPVKSWGEENKTNA